MKRWICAALALLLCMAPLSALCEEEIFSPGVDAEAPPALDAGDTGLTVEMEDLPAEEEGGLAAPEAEGEPLQTPPPEVEAVAETPAIETAPAAGLRLSATELTLGLKETLILAALGLPEGAAVAWSSDNAKIVKVDPATGAVTGLKKGAATVTAEADGAKASCAVTVVKAPGKLTVSPKALNLSADGMTARLEVALPKGSACSSFTYSSSKTSVVTVDADGLIRAVGEGKATVTVRAYNGKSAKCSVTVGGAVARVSFEQDSIAIAEGQKLRLAPRAFTASGAQAPAGFTYTISGASSDMGCVTLDPATGEIVGVRKGQAIVVATAHNGLSASVTVNVAAVPAAIRLSPEELVIGRKETVEGLLTPVLTPPAGESVCAEGVTWSSENPKIARVDAETGAITGLKKGSAVICATTVNGLQAKCRVTVKKAPGKISVEPQTLRMSADGMTCALKVVVPEKCGAAGFIWSSSDASVATVSNAGVVTAVGAGKATITVKTYNGKSAQCKVTVSGVPVRVAFEEESVSLAAGQKRTLKPAAYAQDGTDAAASFSFAISPNSADPGCIALDTGTGEVTGVRKGQAVVIATAHNGLSAAVAVDVVPAPTAIRLSASELSIGVKETSRALQAELVAPAGSDGCSAEISWSSSNSKVVKVDARTGAVTGVKKGSATVTARTDNGLEAKCKVKVYKAPGKVSISPANATLKVGETGKYKVTFPKNCGGGVTFASSKPSVATIDDSGVVTAVHTGEATITVTTYNGKTAKATLKVEPGDGDKPTDDYDDLDSSVDHYDPSMTNAQKIEYLIYVAQKQIGKPYVYGAFGPDKFDCSGFTTYCYRQIKIELMHSAYTQGYDESQKKIERMADLRRGDLVFFDTEEDSDLSDHSGIYLGNGKFIHASSSAKMVIVSTLSSGYYSRVFSWGRRVLE